MSVRIAQQVSYRFFLEQEIRRTSSQIMSMRTASTSTLYQKWANPQVLRTLVEANIGRFLRNLPKRVVDTIGGAVMKAWEGVQGKLARFAELFKDPKIIQTLSSFIGDITPKNVQKFIKKGADALKKVLNVIRMILMRPSDMPTLTDIIKKTAIGANIFDWFEKNVQPRADAVDEWLKKHLPRLRRPLIAAIFAFIWFNVDEISWEWSSLVQGFTGAISLAELLTSLPESIIGLITGRLFGIGMVIMPYALLTRALWLLANNYLEWDGKSWKPNWKNVDRDAFAAA